MSAREYWLSMCKQLEEVSMQIDGLNDRLDAMQSGPIDWRAAISKDHIQKLRENAAIEAEKERVGMLAKTVAALEMEEEIVRAGAGEKSGKLKAESGNAPKRSAVVGRAWYGDGMVREVTEDQVRAWEESGKPVETPGAVECDPRDDGWSGAVRRKPVAEVPALAAVSSRMVLLVPSTRDDERRVRVTIDFEKDDALPAPHERPFWVADDEVPSRAAALDRIREAIEEVWFFGPEHFEKR